MPNENSYKKYGIIISSIIEYYIQCTKVILKTNINKIDISAPNTENLEEIGITLKHICVDKYYSTNVKGYYAIVIPAHVASYEGIIPLPLDSNTEINKGYKFPALGKAKLNDSTDGFIIDDNSGELLGCQARKLETTSFELHPHPTISESVVEAITNAYNKCIHI